MKISNKFLIIIKNESVACNIDSYISTFNDLFKQFCDSKSVKGYYAYIKHNETDKPHYHLFIKFVNKGEVQKRFTIQTISKEFNIIDSNEIEHCGNERKAIRYLVHRDNIEKKQYCVSDIVSNFSLDSYFNESEDNLSELIDFIKGSNEQGEIFSNFGSLVFALRAQTPKLLPFAFKYAYAVCAIMRDINEKSICG